MDVCTLICSMLCLLILCPLFLYCPWRRKLLKIYKGFQNYSKSLFLIEWKNKSIFNVVNPQQNCLVYTYTKEWFNQQHGFPPFDGLSARTWLCLLAFLRTWHWNIWTSCSTPSHNCLSFPFSFNISRGLRRWDEAPEVLLECVLKAERRMKQVVSLS